MVFPSIFTQLKQLPLLDQPLWGTTKISKVNKYMNLHKQANDLNSPEMKVALHCFITSGACVVRRRAIIFPIGAHVCGMGEDYIYSFISIQP